LSDLGSVMLSTSSAIGQQPALGREIRSTHLFSLLRRSSSLGPDDDVLLSSQERRNSKLAFPVYYWENVMSSGAMKPTFDPSERASVAFSKKVLGPLGLVCAALSRRFRNLAKNRMY